ncbi:hypothetical protein IWX49DRAFT_593051 [Phyllosticta citricarpa]|uniref:Uncharacterized protein n=2 Tax=Phyllosticta TaxID=121621 RepID=A0ABR1MJI8_9PEZI
MLVHAVELFRAKWGARQSSNKQPTTPSRESKLQQLKSFASRTSPLNPFVRRSQPDRRAAKQESSPESNPTAVPDRSRLSFTDFNVATAGDYWPDLKWSEHPITGGLPRSHTTSDITLLANRTAESDWRESPPPSRKPTRHHHRGGSLTSFPYANDFATESRSHLPTLSIMPSAPSPPPVPPASTSTPPSEIRPPWLPLNHSPPAPCRRARSPMPLRSYTQPNLLSTISETQKANHFSIPHRTVFREELAASPSPVRSRLRHYQMFPPPAPAPPSSSSSSSVTMAKAPLPTHHQRRRLSSRRRPPPPKPTPLADMFPDDDDAADDNDAVINAYAVRDTNTNALIDCDPLVTAIPTTPSAPWPKHFVRRDSAAALERNDNYDDDYDYDEDDDAVAAAGSQPQPINTFAAHWQAPMSSPMPASPHTHPHNPHHASVAVDEKPHRHQQQRRSQHLEKRDKREKLKQQENALSLPLPLALPATAAAATAAFHLPSRARLSCESVRAPYGGGGGGGGGVCGSGGGYGAGKGGGGGGIVVGGDNYAAAAATVPIGLAI